MFLVLLKTAKSPVKVVGQLIFRGNEKETIKADVYDAVWQMLLGFEGQTWKLHGLIYLREKGGNFPSYPRGREMCMYSRTWTKDM